MDANETVRALAESGWPGLVPVAEGAFAFANMWPVRVLRRIYGDPDLFTVTSPRGGQCLAFWADDIGVDEDHVFVVAPVDDEQIEALQDRKLSIRGALTADPANVRVVIEHLTAGGRIAYSTFRPTCGLPEDALPAPDAVLETYRQYLERVHPERLKEQK